MANRAFFVLFLSLFFSSFLSVFSLYEDQVGLVDWHHQYIGKVKHAVFQTQKAGRKRVVVSTEENVIACLDLRRGEIFWRHLLGDKDSVDQIDIALSKYVITLSSEGTVLRAWNLPDGQMVWETYLAGKAPSNSLLLIATDPNNGRGNVIFVYSNGCLHAVSSLDGTIIWNLELEGESMKFQRLVQPVGSDMVYAVSGSSHLHVYEVSVKTGELLKHEVSEYSGGFSGEISVVSGDTLVALDDATTSLMAVHLKNGNVRFQKKYISDIVPGFSGVAVMLPTKLDGMVAVKIDSFVAFIRVNIDGLMEVVDKIEHPVAISDALSLAGEEHAFGLVQHKGEKVHLFVKLGQDWSGDLLKESIEMDQHRGFVEKVFINNYIKTDRSYGFRALVVMEDHSLLLLQQGNIVWSREDGLASVVDITTSELPVERKGVSVAKVEHNLLDWLKGHLLKIKGSLMLASQEDVAAIQTLRLKSSGKSKMTRDHNGFRKLLIVLTKGKKLFALHTGDGRVVWSLLLPSLRGSGVCRSPSALNVYQWRVPHHHALDENPSVLVVGKCGSSDATTGILSFVDTYTGMELESLTLGHSVAQVIPLQLMDSTERRLHLIIDANGLSHLYPRTTEAATIFQRVLPNLSWYTVDADNSIVKGYALKSNCVAEVDDQFCFDSNDLWSIVFPSDSEKIVCTSTRKANEVVHTQGKLMPDRDVLYKYISKNILFVATAAPKGAGDIGTTTPDESWLVVYLIDTITGRILHRVIHHGSQGPVNAVFSENWVVYHYFNLRAHRYEMSVIEIYDESRANNKDVLKLIVGKHNLTSPISSYSRPEVTAKSQSYFFTHSVKEMAVTLTEKGITSKQLLIGTVGDQILALDKRYLDPRRSINPTQAEKEEGIIPLTDSLPIIPQSYVSHALKVEGLRGIMTVPSKLESTTLMFAHGIDLFFTHLAPSKTYDSLTEDFSYALLLLTIFALVVAIFVTWILSQRKELRDKWR